MKTTIDKAELKKQIIYNVKTLYRKTIDEATPQQVFQAVSYALKDDIIDQWIATHKEIERTDAKTLSVLSFNGVSDGPCSWKQHFKFVCTG